MVHPKEYISIFFHTLTVSTFILVALLFTILPGTLEIAGYGIVVVSHIGLQIGELNRRVAYRNESIGIVSLLEVFRLIAIVVSFRLGIAENLNGVMLILLLSSTPHAVYFLHRDHSFIRTISLGRSLSRIRIDRSFQLFPSVLSNFLGNLSPIVFIGLFNPNAVVGSFRAIQNIFSSSVSLTELLETFLPRYLVLRSAKYRGKMLRTIGLMSILIVILLAAVAKIADGPIQQALIRLLGSDFEKSVWMAGPFADYYLLILLAYILNVLLRTGSYYKEISKIDSFCMLIQVIGSLVLATISVAMVLYLLVSVQALRCSLMIIVSKRKRLI